MISHHAGHIVFNLTPLLLGLTGMLVQVSLEDSPSSQVSYGEDDKPDVTQNMEDAGEEPQVGMHVRPHWVHLEPLLPAAQIIPPNHSSFL